MHKTDYKSIGELQKDFSEAEILNIVNSTLENKNYRSNYNARKNAAMKLLKEDPEVQKRFNALVKKAAKA